MTFGAPAHEYSPVRGDLIRYARMAQGLTMADVRRKGGPSPGYQSDAENALRQDISPTQLRTWANVLGVPVSFLLGEVRRLHEDPDACLGLAADVSGTVLRSSAVNWSSLSAPERVRKLLSLISSHSRRSPRIVLAYVLGFDQVQTLDDIILGSQPVLKPVIDALRILTLLPDNFLQYGEFSSEQNSRAETLTEWAPPPSVSSVAPDGGSHNDNSDSLPQGPVDARGGGCGQQDHRQGHQNT